MKLIEPRNLKGFRDYLPKDQIVRARMLEKIKRVFERFGFEPLETPVLEYEDVLTGKYGEEGEMLMYRFKDNGDRKVAMRYDLTVPLARVVAQYPNELPKPFKRYQVAPVWRAENTQRGRYREFYQCDADMVGAEVGIADAECVAIAEQIILELGIKKFQIQVSNRKLLNAIMLAAGVSDKKIVAAIRAIDKLNKIGAKGVSSELQEKVGMKSADADNLIKLVSTKISNLSALNKFVSDNLSDQPQAQQGLEELSKVFESLEAMQVKNAVIDLALARGMDYYTSTIFEAVLLEKGKEGTFSSVAGGGRYDGLINLFTGKDVPAVGISIGIDRLFSAMQELKLVEKQNVVEVLVLNLDKNLEGQYLNIVSQLRKEGVNSEVYYKDADMKKQFAYAESKSIPFALVLGENEQKKKEIGIRDLQTRKQKMVKINDIVKEIKKVIK
jgi:histidyl-tRNA synthetase